MANITSSNITKNSFVVNWNFSIANISKQTIIISGGPYDKRMPVIEEDIQPSGSKTVSNLEPNSEYLVQIVTNTRDNNGMGIGMQESLIINTLSESSSTPTGITSNQNITSNNNTFKKVLLWFAGLGLFAMIVKIIKNRH